MRDGYDITKAEGKQADFIAKMHGIVTVKV